MQIFLIIVIGGAIIYFINKQGKKFKQKLEQKDYEYIKLNNSNNFSDRTSSEIQTLFKSFRVSSFKTDKNKVKIVIDLEEVV